MRRAAKIDANQARVVAALRALGFSVQSLAAVGQGVPDLLVGRNGKNILLEVKDGAKKPSAQKLTPAEEQWRASWRGQYSVVTDERSAVDACLAQLRLEEKQA